MCVAGAKVWNDHLNENEWPVRSSYQRLSAVVNNSVVIFDLCSELQIIHAILRKMESDGPSEIPMDCWIIDHFLSAAMVVVRAFSRVCEEKHVIAALKRWRFRNYAYTIGGPLP